MNLVHFWKIVVRAIDTEENLPRGGADGWENWILSKDGNITSDISEFSEDMFSVLLGKTDGGARLEVKTVESGEGISAFMQIYQWLMGASELGLQEKARRIMAPTTPKSEEDMAHAIERCLEGCLDIRDMK